MQKRTRKDNDMKIVNVNDIWCCLSCDNEDHFIVFYSLFTFTMSSKLRCDDFICNIIYSLMT